MVAHVLRLRLALLVGALRGGPGRTARILVGFLALVALVVAVGVATASLQQQSLDVAMAVTVLTGTAVVLAAAVGPIVGGIGDQLAPRRFALFGMAPRPLAGTLLLASLISVPSIALLVSTGTVAVMWTARGVPWVAAWSSFLLGNATCLVLARLSMAASASVRERRSRELTALFVLAVVVVLVPVAVFFGSLGWGGTVPRELQAFVGGLSMTPLGAAWAIPGLVEGGAGAPLAIAISVAVSTLLLVVLLWFWAVSRILRTLERPTSGRERAGLGWFSLTPGTPGGAIAARSLIYWLRDRRYVMNFAVIPFAAVLAAMPLLIAGVPAPAVALVPVPLMALLFGWMPHNDMAYDSTAVWLHVVSGVRGLADRAGRLIPILLVAVPVLAIAIPVSVALHGDWSIAPAVVGVAVALFLSGLGLASIASVLAPYAVTRPGDSPFQQPQRAASGFGAQAVVLLGAILCAIPTLWLAFQALVGEGSVTLSFWVGLGTGLVVLAGGVALGAVVFDRRATRIMEFAEAN